MNITTIGISDPKFSDIIRKNVQKHALMKLFIGTKQKFDLYIDSPLKKKIFHCLVSKSDNTLIVQFVGTVTEIPASADVLVVEEGFCHTGDAMEATEGIENPDPYIESNFSIVKKVKRCGCVQCGHIFSGDIVKDRITDFPGDSNGTAVCPYCGGLAVIAEQDGIEITENNLWRWFRHMFGPDSLNPDSADEALAMLEGVEDDDD